MLPLQDVIPSRTTPWVTLLLLVVMTLVVAIELVMPDPELRRIIFSYGVVPAQMRWITLPVATVLHAGLLHATTNFLALWIFGDTLEDRLGHARFALLYASAAASAALFVVWAAPHSMTPFVGATGAVAGVMAAYLVLIPRSRVMVAVPLPFRVDLVEMPAAFLPAFWGLFQLIGTAGEVAAESHVARQMLWAMIGGGLAGAAAVWLLRRPERASPDWWSPGREAEPPTSRSSA